MCLCSTVLALDFVSFLPKEVAVVATVDLVIELVNTGALHIGRESCFICSLVNALATSGAA